METVKTESREYGFYQRIADNPDLWSPISTLVQNLKDQGVLEMFICGDKVDELNSLLSAKLPEFKAFVTSDAYNAAFEPILIQNAVSKIYDKKQDNATDTEIQEEVNNFVDNPNWAKIFEAIWGQAHMVMKFGYQSQIKRFKRVTGAANEEPSQIEKLFQEAFPISAQIPLPAPKWVKERQELFNAVNLYDILTDAYVDDVADNIQHMSQKAMRADVREAVDIVATDCTERYILAEILKREKLDGLDMTALEMHTYVKTVKSERPWYIMGLYYIFAHKCFHMLTAGK